MALDPTDLSDDVLDFLRERHLATLTTLRPDGSPHVVAVGFTWDDEAHLARVITWDDSKKARNVLESPGSRAVVSQVGHNDCLVYFVDYGSSFPHLAHI